MSQKHLRSYDNYVIAYTFCLSTPLCFDLLKTHTYFIRVDIICKTCPGKAYLFDTEYYDTVWFSIECCKTTTKVITHASQEIPNAVN